MGDETVALSSVLILIQSIIHQKFEEQPCAGNVTQHYYPSDGVWIYVSQLCYIFL